MKFGRLLVAAAVGGAGFLFGAGNAHANSIVVSNLPGGIVANGSGGNTFDYSVSLTAANQLKSGDFFTIFDFEGLLSATVLTNLTAGTWAFSSAMGGPAPASAPGSTQGALPGFLGDSSVVENITFTYTGSTVTALDFTAPTPLFTFQAVSKFLGVNVDSYVAQDHVLSGPVTSNVGQVLVAFDPAGPQTLPLPGAVWGGMALMGLVAGGKLRRKPA